MRISRKTANPERKTTFTPIADELAYFTGLTAWDVLIHARLDRYKKGEAYPSYEYLAKFARCSRRSAIRSVKKLEKLGLLRVERRKDKTCIFAALKPWKRKQGVTDCHPKIQGSYKAKEIPAAATAKPFRSLLRIGQPSEPIQSTTAAIANLVSWSDTVSPPSEVAA